MHLQRYILAPTLYPLGAFESAGSTLGLTAAARAATPTSPVSLQHSGFDAMFARQKNSAGESRVAGADDGNVNVHLPRYRTIVFRRLSGSVNPVSGRIFLSLARGRCH